MTYVDDRTDEQKQTHLLAVVGTDPGMSGWGGAEGGASYAGWAFEDGELSGCLGMVAARRDMNRIRVVELSTYRPKAAHTHIYVYHRRIHG